MLDKLKKYILQQIEKRAFPILAVVEKNFTQAGKYCVECRELHPNGEKTDTVYMEVPVPKLIGSAKGGVWLAPSKDTIVLLNFLNGDRNYPIVAGVMGGKTEEEHPEEELIIKLGETELRLADKIILKNGTASLGEVLQEIVKLSTELKTLGAPSPHSLSPDLITKWELLKSQKIEGLFK